MLKLEARNGFFLLEGKLLKKQKTNKIMLID